MEAASVCVRAHWSILQHGSRSRKTRLIILVHLATEPLPSNYCSLAHAVPRTIQYVANSTHFHPWHAIERGISQSHTLYGDRAIILITQHFPLPARITTIARECGWDVVYRYIHIRRRRPISGNFIHRELSPLPTRTGSQRDCSKQRPRERESERARRVMYTHAHTSLGQWERQPIIQIIS